MHAISKDLAASIYYFKLRVNVSKNNEELIETILNDISNDNNILPNDSELDFLIKKYVHLKDIMYSINRVHNNSDDLINEVTEKFKQLETLFKKSFKPLTIFPGENFNNLFIPNAEDQFIQFFVSLAKQKNCSKPTPSLK